MPPSFDQSDKSDKSSTNEAGCHCGYIKFSVTLSPPLNEQEVFDCGCSICRRAGYLLVYPRRDQVKWHGDSRARCSSYRFNRKDKEQLFCGKCGSSLGIDFLDFWKPKFDGYGISVRTFNNINLDDLRYEKGDGINNVPPKGDLSGIWYQEEEEDAGAEKEEQETKS